MKVSKILFLLFLFGLVSCSNQSAQNDVDQEAEEIVIEESEEDADFVVDSEEEDLILENDETESLLADTQSDSKDLDLEEDLIVETQEVSEEITPANYNSGDYKHGEYIVQKGDTLMLIAFKLFGDYSKWREILSSNPGLSQSKLAAGKSLKYKMTGELFQWNPKGNPYLIKGGDTLGTISNDKYGTQKKWKLIYNNNRPLIKDPNLIFAGFTLYYIPKRDIASE